MKSAFENPSVLRVHAAFMLRGGKVCGKIVSHASRRGVVTVSMYCFAGPFKSLEDKTEKAGGYGYNKFDYCLACILGCRQGEGSKALKEAGYSLEWVI